MENICNDSLYNALLCFEASAGTGKTTKLALRYLKLIEKTEPENIIAITFTNKATNEMKKKILTFLKKIALDSCDELEYLKSFTKDFAFENLEKILFHYHNFRVATIDSFLSFLAKNFTFDLLLPPNPEISLSDEYHVENSLKAYLESIKPQTDEEKNFLKYFNKIYNFKNNMDWAFFKEIKKEIENLYKIEKKTSRDIKIEDDEELCSLADEIKKILKTIPPDFLDGRCKQGIEKFLKGEKKLSEISIKFKKNYEDKYKNILKKQKEYKTLEIKTGKFPSNDIYNGFKKFFDTYLNKENTITINHLNKILRDKIKNLDYPSKYISVAEKLNHFLIDEFQDTSPLQWDTIKPLIEEALSTGGTFFYIGDKKQAIYSFRGGDYRIFDKPKLELRRDLIIGNLNVNYRSYKKIIEFVKEIFSEENLKKTFSDKEIFFEDIKKHYKMIKNSEIKEKKEGYVRVDLVPDEEKNTEEVEEEVLSHLKNLIKEEILKNFNPEEITILVRTNNEARNILTSLLANDIPAISPSALGIFSCKSIKETISFLNFLNNRDDNLNFAFFLLSDIFTKKTNTKKEEWQKFIFYLSKSKYFNLFYSFKDHYKDLYESYFKDLIYLPYFLSPYEILLRFFETFDVFKNFQEEEGFFYALLEYVLSCQEEGIFSLEEIISKMEDEEAEPSVIFPKESNAIKIMTIHKAKGLEFPVVILPFAKIDNFRADRAIFYKEDKEFVYPLYLNKENNSVNEEFKNIYKGEHTRYLIDEMNILYVGLTRAKEALYIIVPNLKSGHYIFPIKKEPLKRGEIFRMKKEKEREEERKELLIERKGNWSEKLSRHFIDISLYEKRERYEEVKEGIELHKKMEKGKFEKIPEKFKEIISKKDFENIFFEKEIVDENGEILRVDLIIKSAEMVKLVDFKFGEKKNEHLEQIKKYLKLVKKIEGKKVKGFLLYFDKEEVLEVNEN